MNLTLADWTISDVSGVCLIAIVFYSLAVLKKSNFWSVFIFAVAALSFWIPLGWIPYEKLGVYFFSAAVIDFTILEIISLPRFKITKLTTRLKGICLAFIALDLTGWVAFKFTEFDYITDIYNCVCLLLYASILVIITKEKENVRNNAAYHDNHNRSNIPVNYSQGNISVHSCEEKSRA